MAGPGIHKPWPKFCSSNHPLNNGAVERDSNCRIRGPEEIWVEQACEVTTTTSSECAESETNQHLVHCHILTYFIIGVVLVVCGLISCICFVVYGMLLKLYIMEFGAAAVLYTATGVSSMVLSSPIKSTHWRLYLLAVATADISLGLAEVALRINGIQAANTILGLKEDLGKAYYKAGRTALVISCLFLALGIMAAGLGLALLVLTARQQLQAITRRARFSGNGELNDNRQPEDNTIYYPLTVV